VVTGDFNCNVLDEKGYFSSKAYKPLIDAGSTLELRPPEEPPKKLEGYLGYFATHIKDRNDTNLKFWSTSKDKTYYPCYGYHGSTAGMPQSFALDNAFTRHGKGAFPPTKKDRFTIINPVVGSPYAKFEPPKGCPIGVVDFAIKMIVSVHRPD
jgi:hypothetical protein